jgi:hypothetical protein
LARFVFAGTASLAVLSGNVRGARAQEPCARLITPPGLPAAWASAVGDLTKALAELPPAECRPLTLVLELDDGRLRLIAQAPDGQRAVRPVAQPSLLVPLTLGLVASGSTEAAAASSSASPLATAAPPAPPELPPRPGVPRPDAPSSAPPAAGTDVASSHALSLWLGLGIGVREGVPSTISMADVEARADLRVDRLLLFVSFRNVPIGFVAGQGFDGDAYHESSIAFGVGRSVALGRYVLDLSIAPSLVTMRLSKDTPVHVHADDVEFRVGASARFNIPLSPSWALTLSVDTDVIPDLLRSEERIDPLPAFPSWTSGLCLGVAGAAL